jgi:hypothetical protein
MFLFSHSRRWIPFPTKLSPGQADEARRLRARGLPLAAECGIAKSTSVSAIVKYRAHEPPGTLRGALPEFERC